jgi:hypothetical protein
MGYNAFVFTRYTKIGCTTATQQNQKAVDLKKITITL